VCGVCLCVLCVCVCVSVYVVYVFVCLCVFVSVPVLMPEKRGKSYRKRRPTRLNLASLDPGGAWRICSSLINAGFLMNAWFEIRLLSSFIFKKPNKFI